MFWSNVSSGGFHFFLGVREAFEAIGDRDSVASASLAASCINSAR